MGRGNGAGCGGVIMAARREGDGGSPQAASATAAAPSLVAVVSVGWTVVVCSVSGCVGRKLGWWGTSQNLLRRARRRKPARRARSFATWARPADYVCSPPSAKSGLAIDADLGFRRRHCRRCCGHLGHERRLVCRAWSYLDTPGAATAPAPPPAARGHTTSVAAGAGTGDKNRFAGRLWGGGLGGSRRGRVAPILTFAIVAPRSSTAPEFFQMRLSPAAPDR